MHRKANRGKSTCTKKMTSLLHSRGSDQGNGRTGTGWSQTVNSQRWSPFLRCHGQSVRKPATGENGLAVGGSGRQPTRPATQVWSFATRHGISARVKSRPAFRPAVLSKSNSAGKLSPRLATPTAIGPAGRRAATFEFIWPKMGDLGCCAQGPSSILVCRVKRTVRNGLRTFHTLGEEDL
jgi:hypothetical protein